MGRVERGEMGGVAGGAPARGTGDGGRYQEPVPRAVRELGDIADGLRSWASPKDSLPQVWSLEHQHQLLAG